MKIVYVAGPFTGPNAWEIARNVRRAEALGLEVARAGAAPLIPHAMTQHLYGVLDEAFWYAATIELLRRCDALVTVPGWEDSKGTKAEIVEAVDRGLPVFSTIELLKTWPAKEA